MLTLVSIAVEEWHERNVNIAMQKIPKGSRCAAPRIALTHHYPTATMAVGKFPDSTNDTTPSSR